MRGSRSAYIIHSFCDTLQISPQYSTMVSCPNKEILWITYLELTKKVTCLGERLTPTCGEMTYVWYRHQELGQIQRHSDRSHSICNTIVALDDSWQTAVKYIAVWYKLHDTQHAIQDQWKKTYSTQNLFWSNKQASLRNIKHYGSWRCDACSALKKLLLCI